MAARGVDFASPDVVEGVQHGLALLWGRRLAEHVPEAQRLVPGASNDRLAVRGHGKVEHSQRVPSQHCDLLHRRILPNHNFVLGIAVGGDNLVYTLGPSQIADLSRVIVMSHSDAS